MAPAAQEWFILYGVPKVAPKEVFPGSTNMSFTFDQAPLPSHVTLVGNVFFPTSTVNYPYIAATDRSGILLLCGYTAMGLAYYLCDPLICRTLGIVPHVGGLRRRHCVGLICNRSDGRLLVAELNPWLLADSGRVTVRCTMDMYDWAEKESDCSNIVDRRSWRGSPTVSSPATPSPVSRSFTKSCSRLLPTPCPPPVHRSMVTYTAA
jgi:hypothetical protein